MATKSQFFQQQTNGLNPQGTSLITQINFAGGKGPMIGEAAAPQPQLQPLFRQNGAFIGSVAQQ
jgi:hypothetical protein